MGSNNSEVTEVLPISQGTSHRAVQDGLTGLVKGNFDFDYETCLREIEKMLANSTDETVKNIIFVYFVVNRVLTL